MLQVLVDLPTWVCYKKERRKKILNKKVLIETKHQKYIISLSRIS